MIGNGTMGDLMAGKRGLIMGVANHNSIAWGAAKALSAHGADIALTYQGEAFGRRVRPLAEEIGRIVVMGDAEEALHVAHEGGGIGLHLLVEDELQIGRVEAGGRAHVEVDDRGLVRVGLIDDHRAATSWATHPWLGDTD